MVPVCPVRFSELLPGLFWPLALGERGVQIRERGWETRRPRRAGREGLFFEKTSAAHAVMSSLVKTEATHWAANRVAFLTAPLPTARDRFSCHPTQPQAPSSECPGRAPQAWFPLPDTAGVWVTDRLPVRGAGQQRGDVLVKIKPSEQGAQRIMRKNQEFQLGTQTTRLPASEAVCLQASVRLKVWPQHPQHQWHLRASWKCRIPGPPQAAESEPASDRSAGDLAMNILRTPPRPVLGPFTTPFRKLASGPLSWRPENPGPRSRPGHW